MSNLIEIQSQIQKLQAQASAIKAKEFDATVRDILAKMEAFGISVKDLQDVSKKSKSGKGRGRPSTKVKAGAKPGPKKKTAGTSVSAKYKGPNGETWSGRGLTPRWMSSLIAQGQSKESFAIAG